MTWYEKWHRNEIHPHIHWGILVLVCFGVSSFLISHINFTYNTAYAASLPSALVMGSDHIPDFSQDGTKTKVTTVSSGNWSDPAVWSSGAVPTGSQIAVIAGGHTITYDSTTGVAYTISVHGSLKFRTDITTKLTVTNLEVMSDGYLEIGTTGTPIAENVQAEIVFADNPLDTSQDPEQWGNGLVSLGKVRINGAVKDSTFIRLATEPSAGQTTLQLSAAPTGWKVGDRILIPDTHQVLDKSINNTSQIEIITASAISGTTVTLSSPLVYNHKGAHDGDGAITFFPHAANLTRNVIFHSANPNGVRGHVAMIHMADVDIRYAQFLEMGRTTTDQIDNAVYDSSGNATHVGTNQKGRYALHMHHDIGMAQSNGYQFTLIGNLSDGGTVAHSKFKWGITVHDSHYGLIKDNIAYNFAGSGFMTEDGSESYNLFDHNLSVKGWSTRPNRGDGCGTDNNGKPDFGCEATGFYFRGPNNYVRNNTATDIMDTGPNSDYGYQIFPFYLGNVNVPNFAGADTTITGQYTLKNGNAMPVLEFSDNEVYGATESGMTLWWIGTADTYINTQTPESVIKNLHIWNVSHFGIFNYPGYHITYDGLVIRGDASAIPGSAAAVIGYYGPDYFAYNDVIKNADIQGMDIGIVPSTFSGGGDQTIQDSYLRNNQNIQIITMFTSSCNSLDLKARKTIIKNVKFAAPANKTLQSIVFGYSTAEVRNLTQVDQVLVYDYNQMANQNFQAYYKEQAPDYIVPKKIISAQYGSGCVSVNGSPESGLTNTQNWAKYHYDGTLKTVSTDAGLAIAGAVAPCTDATTHPEVINGLTCAIGTQPPPPPPPPPPTLTLTASPTTITSGNSSTLTWVSTDATSCTASDGWSGSKATSGTQSVNPTVTTTYTLTCSGASSVSKSVIVTVTSATDTTPPTVSISAPNSGTTVSGTSVTVSANATDDVAVAGVQFKVDGSNIGTEDTTSPYSVSWDTITVSNGSHSLTAVARDTSSNTATSAAVSVTISNSGTTPTISSFTSSPTSITSGSSSTLSWTTTGATSLSIDNGVGTVTGLTSKSVLPTTTTTYTLTATNASGSVTSTATVTVSGTPLAGDLNLDHIVNSLDWSIMNSKWFTDDPIADLNKDGIVNSIDFSILNNNWFKTW